jgi:hypothetical protein
MRNAGAQLRLPAMSDYPADIFTDPADIDPHTPEGPKKQAFIERFELQPIGVETSRTLAIPRGRRADAKWLVRAAT